MTYKTISTVLTEPSGLPPLLGAAIVTARNLEAHLDVLALGVDRTQAGYYYADASAVLVQQAITEAREESQRLEAAARKLLEAEEIRWSLDTGLAQMMDIGRKVSDRLRYADLALLPKPYGKDLGNELPAVLEAALFDARTPVLVLPGADPLPKALGTALICWNESPESLAAVRAAIPFLKTAQTTRVLIVDPPVHGAGRSDPGGMLAQWLSRHGIRVEIDVMARTMPRVADVFIRQAQDIEAELVVLGGYGHSRFREAVLGGATRDMLEAAELPMLMAH
ncbi:universal stress protein [Pseudooceanicola sp. C21-150M6]|uniref:universal stress protein n=1 Tax=Pseudooceanicola sp. C21-150M6 TaxID=3434355 RepID=UPI003D7FAFE2